MSVPAPRFECSAGTVLGWRDGDVVRATGIRYARAGRWAPPSPEPAASDPILATSPSPACPQPRDEYAERVINPGMLGDLPFDEHCQRLSVTMPTAAGRGERLPVLVFVHGGAYATGAGDAPINDPATLVREQRVVVVTVTYRLGLFGFLGSPPERPANLGLLDLVEAVRWVRRNIAAFGGDPDQVTLYGESAGADAVAHLMIADGTAGLFRRAILQSPPLGISPGRAAMTAALAREAAKLPPDAAVGDVLAVQERIAKRAKRYGPFISGMPFGFQYGFPPLPAEQVADRAWARVAPDVDVLIGRTTREGAANVPAARTVLPALTRIPVAGLSLREAVVSLITHRAWSTGIDAFARRHAGAGGRVYRYLLRYGDPGNPLADSHATDLPLTFPNRRLWESAPLLAGVSWDDVERHGREIRKILAGFARTGAAPVPGVDGLVTISAG